MRHVQKQLVVISGYDTMIDNIQSACQELRIVPTIIEWEISDRAFIERLEQLFIAHGELPDVVVARGALAGLVERNFRNIVVVRAEPDNLDLLEALAQARTVGSRLGFLIYTRHAYAFKVHVARKLLGLEELKAYTYQTHHDIERQIRRAIKDGLHAVVGGGTLGQRQSLRWRFPVVFVESGKCAVQQALVQALGIIDAREGEKRHLHSLETVVGSVQEGIVTVENQKVTLVNHMAASILGISAAPSSLGAGKTHLRNTVIAPVPPLPLSALDPQVRTFLSGDSAGESILPLKGQRFLLKKVRLSAALQPPAQLLMIRDISQIQRQEHRIRLELLNKGHTARYRFENLLGDNPGFRTQIDKARVFATTNANVLIHGESGTGKELFAQSLHNASARSQRPFVAVNCAAIPATLLESELFGYEEGAFTGARRSGKAGLFELAHEGTIFLDEINSLPIALQGVLLRVIQEKEIRRVGSQNLIAVDIRIISATNCQLEPLIATNAFRPDLYYRLNTLSLELPPLTRRKEDILPLARSFRARFMAEHGFAVPDFSEDDCACLQHAPWPGNVRELENVIHRYVLLNTSSPSGYSIKNCLDPHTTPVVRPNEIPAPSPGQPLAHLERDLLLATLRQCHGNRQQAAAQLGINRTSLWRKLKKYELLDE